jgi:adenosine deaminase
MFRPLYRMGKEAGLRLKAHVGEWGDAESVWRTAEELELDEVQHGIAAADSKPVMRFLADHKISLNICPTSNVMLGRVSTLTAGTSAHGNAARHRSFWFLLIAN